MLNSNKNLNLRNYIKKEQTATEVAK